MRIWGGSSRCEFGGRSPCSFLGFANERDADFGEQSIFGGHFPDPSILRRSVQPLPK